MTKMADGAEGQLLADGTKGTHGSENHQRDADDLSMRPWEDPRLEQSETRQLEAPSSTWEASSKRRPHETLVG